MSFSKTVKDEIMKKYSSKKDSKALLQGLFFSSGTIDIYDGNIAFYLSNENEDVILFVASELEKLFPKIDIGIAKVVKSFKSKERFELYINDFDSCKNVLKELGIIKINENNEVEFFDIYDKSFLKNKETIIDFLIGFFLGNGTISVPVNDSEKMTYGYHFEISTSSKQYADFICELFSDFDIFPKQIERGEEFVIYLKNCDSICDVLALFGASKTVLTIFNQQALRDMNNKINRQSNCFSANMEKSLSAAATQFRAICLINETIGIENLPDNLVETALARFANPERSLKDLLVVMDNKVSKSTLSQRLNKIVEIAKELGDEDVKNSK